MKEIRISLAGQNAGATTGSQSRDWWMKVDALYVCLLGRLICVYNVSKQNSSQPQKPVHHRSRCTNSCPICIRRRSCCRRCRVAQRPLRPTPTIIRLVQGQTVKLGFAQSLIDEIMDKTQPHRSGFARRGLSLPTSTLDIMRGRKSRAHLRWIFFQKHLEFGRTFSTGIQPRKQVEIGF